MGLLRLVWERRHIAPSSVAGVNSTTCYDDTVEYYLSGLVRSDLSEKSYNEADGRTAVTSTVHRSSPLALLSLLHSRYYYMG